MNDVPGAIWIAFAFALGAIVGSFLNVVIYRVPRELSIVSPRSRCPTCEHPIPGWANVPLPSWLALRGRCHRCGTPIGVQYPMVELATALLFTALVLEWGPGLYALTYCVVGAALIATAFIDGEHRVIPNRITLPGIVLGLVFAGFAPAPTLVDAALGVALVGGGMWALSSAAEWWYGRVALGMGDVKLVAMLGAFLGLQPAIGVVALGSMLGLLQAGIWMGLGRADRRTPIPFGPALAAAGIVHLWDPRILSHLLASLPLIIGSA